MFSRRKSVLQLGSAEQFMQGSKFLIHGNGKDKPPTGFMFEKEQMKGLYFNQSPAKVWCNSQLKQITLSKFFKVNIVLVFFPHRKQHFCRSYAFPL